MLLHRGQRGDRALVLHVDLLGGHGADVRPPRPRRGRRSRSGRPTARRRSSRPCAAVNTARRPTSSSTSSIGARAVRPDAELAALRGVHDQEGIVVESLGNRRGSAALPLRRKVYSSTFSIALASHSLVDFLATPLSSFSPVSKSIEHEALEQADDGRAGLGVEHALEVPDGVVGGEVPAALAPLHVLAEHERPGLQVFAGVPLLDEMRARDVVGAGVGEIVERLARGVRALDPGIGVRAGEILHAHADAQRAALLGRGRLGLAGVGRPAMP